MHFSQARPPTREGPAADLACGYDTPEVQKAAFALPGYKLRLMP